MLDAGCDAIVALSGVSEGLGECAPTGQPLLHHSVHPAQPGVHHILQIRLTRLHLLEVEVVEAQHQTETVDLRLVQGQQVVAHVH